MPPSARPDAIRSLSVALSDALEMVPKSAAGPRAETENLGSLRRLTDHLMEAFDLGEMRPTRTRQRRIRFASGEVPR